MNRSLSIITVVVVLTTSTAHAAVAAPTTRTGWVRPVAGAVVRPFAAPTGPYGPGHRGVDLAAKPGGLVRAAGPGIVTFAGIVGGTRHVVIRHDGAGWVTGYSFLTSSAVAAGSRIRGGAVIGTSGGGGPGHDTDVVHVSLRVGGVYRDPMVLFGALDLGRAVHLVPWGSTVPTAVAPQTPAPQTPAPQPGLFHSVYLAVLTAALRGQSK